MSEPRSDLFIDRVKSASEKPVRSYVHDPRPTGKEPGRADVGSDVAATFVERAEATGMTVSRVSAVEDAAAVARSWMDERNVTTAMVWDVPELRDLADAMEGIHLSWWKPDSPTAKDDAFAMSCGITTVDYAVAETGALVACGGAAKGRSVTMLGEYHVAIVRKEQILADLYDLFPRLQADYPDGLPPSISLIAGPSKTADIELQLVIGVHGPGDVHVILVE